jgi:hypothetical protein
MVLQQLQASAAVGPKPLERPALASSLIAAIVSAIDRSATAEASMRTDGAFIVEASNAVAAITSPSAALTKLLAPLAQPLFAIAHDATTPRDRRDAALRAVGALYAGAPPPITRSLSFEFR